MTHPEIARRRLRSQRLVGPRFADPAEAVRWMGAVQAQDYGGAKWAAAQRCDPMPSARQMDEAVDQGRILRTHVLRPTWHFVHPADARWMLALTGPRVLRGMAARHRELLLDELVFEQCGAVLREVLSGGRSCTRAELEDALHQAGISTSLPQRFAHILMQAELTGLLISGPWRGKQNTYALLDERVPPDSAPLLEGERAQAELARRFFTSHGPATLKDFGWWSGLTLTAGRAAVEALGDALTREVIGEQAYYRAADGEDFAQPSPNYHLLPNYDEYVVAYTDRSAIFDPAYAQRLHLRGGVLNNVLLEDGLVTGGWSRELKPKSVRVTLRPLEPLTTAAEEGLERATELYAEHLGLELI